SLAVFQADGRIGFVSVKDAEDPDSRMRVEVDSGRASIRPRSKPLPQPAMASDALALGQVAPCRFGAQGFVFAEEETELLWRATARGQTLPVKTVEREPVTALAALPGSGQVVLAHSEYLAFLSEDGGTENAPIDLAHEVTGIAVSADEKRLACWGEGQISIVDLATRAVTGGFSYDSEIHELVWSPCQAWLAAGCVDRSILLADLVKPACDRIVDFPDEVRSLGFSAAGGALVAAGAYRIVGWHLPDLPFGTHEGTPIATGKPGLTIVDRVAPHPQRDLCAVAYANGLVVICRVGHPDEMLLRAGTNIAVNSLEWSPDGTHLAIADADGAVSIATFPKNMFK
ncbi:MAG: WD40 repeat domain-containing protein, partial [Mangrovicoccus sp.]